MSLAGLKKKLPSCDYLFYKVLSRNDKSWAQAAGTHQGGFVVPQKALEKMFPKKELLSKAKPGFVGDRYYAVRMLREKDGEWEPYYTGDYWARNPKLGMSYGKDKKDRDEYRITGGLDKEMFKNAPSGSILVLARDKTALSYKSHCYYYDIYHPGEPDYDHFLRDYSIRLIGVTGGYIDLEHGEVAFTDEMKELVDEYMRKSLAGEYKNRLANEFARMTWRAYLHSDDPSDYNSLFSKTPTPGNLIEELMQLSWTLERLLQLRSTYPDDILEILGVLPGLLAYTHEDLRGMLVSNFEPLRKFISNIDQHGKTTVGRVLERHIELWLHTKRIPYEAQQTLDTGKKPDFVIPSRQFYLLPPAKRAPDDAAILAAKTKCRERWAQVLHEGNLVNTRYLLTTDTDISKKSLGDFTKELLFLVVSENSQQQVDAYYRSPAVISFQQLYERLEEIRKHCEKKGASWILPEPRTPWWEK